MDSGKNLKEIAKGMRKHNKDIKIKRKESEKILIDFLEGKQWDKE